MARSLALRAALVWSGGASSSGCQAQVEAVRLELLELRGRPGSSDHLGAERFPRLQGCDADARGNSGNEQPFSLLELPLRDEHVVHHCKGDGNRRRHLP